jgi:hypothetical protein
MARTTFSGPVASDNGFITTISNNSTGSSAFNASTTSVTMTGVGGTGGRTLFKMDTNVALGGFSNALKAEVTYGASGRTTGLGSAFVAEMTLSAGTSAGTYAPVEIELNMGASASTGTASSLLFASVNGAAGDKATFDTNGYLLNLAGVTAGASKMFANNGTVEAAEITYGLKVKIAGADYYLLAVTAADFVDA